MVRGKEVMYEDRIKTNTAFAYLLTFLPSYLYGMT